MALRAEACAAEFTSSSINPLAITAGRPHAIAIDRYNWLAQVESEIRRASNKGRTT